MRPKRPTHALLDQIRITREGEIATIDHADPNLSGAHITVGPQIASTNESYIVKIVQRDSRFAMGFRAGLEQDGRRATARRASDRLP